MLREIQEKLLPPALLDMSGLVWSRLRRGHVARRLSNLDKLHLACGGNILKGWGNIDLASGVDVVGWNLTRGLPVRDNAVDLIFCEHFIEHVSMDQALALLLECHRCLRPEGTLRLSTPDLKKMLEQYELGRTCEWHDVGWHPATPCSLVNEGLRLWGHQFVYDEAELFRILRQAGFDSIQRVGWRESRNPALRNLECRPFHGEIILEASKSR